MKSRMFFILLFSVIRGLPQKIAKPAQEKIKYDCDASILRSYMLKGRAKTSDTEPVIVCPDIKYNCCTKYDQQKIYHHVNDVFMRRIREYVQKFKMSMKKLSRLHHSVTNTKLVFRGSINRKLFCTKQAQNLIRYPINMLYDKIDTEIDVLELENKEFHQRFFCILCDGSNHRFFEFESANPKITFDMQFCKDHFYARRAILKLVNIELIEYLMNLQNVIDCKHYSKSYNLRFFDESKIEKSTDIAQCLNYMETGEFYRYCKPLCQSIKISKIHTEIEGDYEFLTDALNFMERMFGVEEKVPMVDSKKNSFIKKYLAKKIKEKPKNRKLINSYEDSLSISKYQSRIVKKIKLKKQERKLALQMRLKSGDKALTQRRNRKKERNLADFDKGFIGINKRVLEQTKHFNFNRRILIDTPNKKQVKVKESDPYYDKQVYPFYQEIIVNSAANSKTIYQIDAKPIDFDAPNKVFQIKLGVNPENYQILNFDIPYDEFYKKLFLKVKREKYNIEIQYLVHDFNKEFVDYTTNELETEYKIDKYLKIELPQPIVLNWWQRILNFIVEAWKKFLSLF